MRDYFFIIVLLASASIGYASGRWDEKRYHVDNIDNIAYQKPQFVDSDANIYKDLLSTPPIYYEVVFPGQPFTNYGLNELHSDGTTSPPKYIPDVHCVP